MNRKINLIFATALVILVFVASGFQVYALEEKSYKEKAELTVKIAENACLRLGNLINMTKANATAMQAIQDAGLMEDFEGNVSLYESGKGLLFEAMVKISNGDYSGAINAMIRAMETFRNAIRGIMRILAQAGIEKGGLPKAQGILVAVNRALERIDRIEKILPEGAEDIKELLNQAKSLLNVDEITQLLQQGNATGAAHRLAEANKLINEAFKALRTKAEEKMAERMNRFCEKLEKRLGEILENITEKGFNATDILKNHNMSEFRESLNQLKEGLLKGKITWKGALPQLERLQRVFEDFNRKAAVELQPKVEEGNPAIEVTVEKNTRGATVLLIVTVKNVGDAIVQFPNSAYGIIIEKKEGEQWVFAYAPISAQVIIELKPGQNGHVTITLNQLENGHYRVYVNGWSKISMAPVKATVEFSIP
ncbi:MAG: hypothetical protein QW497_03770 [Candidatus Bathyarchaeia archaeon]